MGWLRRSQRGSSDQVAVATSTFERRSADSRSTARGRFTRQIGRRAGYFLSEVLRHKQGATAIEYALVAGIISIVIITAVGAIGDQLNLWAGDVQAGLSGAAP